MGRETRSISHRARVSPRGRETRSASTVLRDASVLRLVHLDERLFLRIEERCRSSLSYRVRLLRCIEKRSRMSFSCRCLVERLHLRLMRLFSMRRESFTLDLQCVVTEGARREPGVHREPGVVVVIMMGGVQWRREGMPSLAERGHAKRGYALSRLGWACQERACTLGNACVGARSASESDCPPSSQKLVRPQRPSQNFAPS